MQITPAIPLKLNRYINIFSSRYFVLAAASWPSLLFRDIVIKMIALLDLLYINHIF